MQSSAALRLYQDPARLAQQHKALDMELHYLKRRAFLTPAEQDRARVLKKLKLQAKDRLHSVPK